MQSIGIREATPFSCFIARAVGIRVSGYGWGTNASEENSLI